MKSRSKTEVTPELASRMTRKAGLGAATEIAPLGAGEFNTVLAVTTEDGKRYALKVAPSDESRILTYEKNMMRAEVYWYGVLRDRTDIPVPEIFFSDFSRELLPADWFIMQLIEGTHPEGSTSPSDNSLTRDLTRMAAKMHSVRGDRFGYVQGEHYDDWYSAVRGMTAALLEDGKRKGVRSRRGEKLLALIDRHREVLEKAECCAVNYELWTPNIIVQGEGEDRKLWWIDPERTFYGDRVADFVCFDFFKPYAEKTVAIDAYNSVAELPVGKSREFEVRWAVMMAYMGLLQEVEKHYRYTPFMFGWWRNVISSGICYRMAFKVLEAK